MKAHIHAPPKLLILRNIRVMGNIADSLAKAIFCKNILIQVRFQSGMNAYCTHPKRPLSFRPTLWLIFGQHLMRDFMYGMVFCPIGRRMDIGLRRW